ncbi:MAG TPA: ATP-binding protein [Burkholderiaceae bacterium]|nr:ATP-binding protein [Burkholderiaceae bacterium]
MNSAPGPTLPDASADAVVRDLGPGRRRPWSWSGGPRRFLLIGVTYVLLYVLLDVITPQTWNPQPALAMALVAWGGLRYVPLVFLGALIADLVASPSSGPGIVVAALIVTAAYSAGGYAVGRFTRIGRSDATARDLSRFLVVALVCAVLAALADAVVSLGDPRLPLRALALITLERLTGNVVGVVVVGTLLLQWTGGALPELFADPSARRGLLRDLALFLVLLAVALVAIFGVKPLDEFRMFYLLFLPALAIAMRQGLSGAAVAAALVQAGLLLALVVSQTRAATALEFQLLMLALAITTLYIGALAGERARQAVALDARAAELRRQSEALADAQRVAATAELAGALAHELNQPLSAISNYARASRLIAEQGHDRALLLDTLARIADESARAGEFVRRMRDFYRSGQLHLLLCPVGELLRDAAGQPAERSVRLGVEVQVDCVPPDLVLRADRVQLGTVLANLVKNALDALESVPPPRKLWLRAWEVSGPGRIVIEVADTGAGVAPEVRATLFDPMTTTKPQGMGLGLAMSRRIVERHGGRIWLESPLHPTSLRMDFPAPSVPTSSRPSS